MSPRKYDMGRREAAREETRRRIVEATAKLHGERGVFGTSWRDIAEEADVAVGTVYSHFPTLDELLPACGRLVMERARPPVPESAAEIVADAHDAEERLLRVARELFRFYERGGPHLEVDARERELPGMREWEESQRADVLTFVRTALEGHADARQATLVSAFFDLPTYKALRTRGASTERAAATVARAAACLIDREGREKART